MTFTGYLHNRRVRVLIDSGASDNYLSTAFVNQYTLPTVPNYAPAVMLADGHKSDASRRVEDQHLRLGHRQITFNAVVTKLQHYDLILGAPWFRAHGPIQMDYDQRTCTFQLAGRTIVLSANLYIDDAGTQLSALQAKRALRNPDTPAYLAFIRPAPSPGLDKETLATVPEECRDLIQEFSDVFPEKLPYGLPPDRGDAHAIELEPGSKPPFQSIYHQSPAELKEVEKQLRELIDAGHIRPSKSPFGAPILFVKKKEGTLRMCMDYRALNKITIKNRYPLPRIDELLDKLNGARYFTKIDLRSGYHQIRVQPTDVHKTAFRTRYGHFEFTVMPFGLTNAPATFQESMNNILREFLDQFVVVYLDDILIFSRTKEEHGQHLRKVLGVLRRHQFYAKLSKCEFFRPRVEFVGFRVSDGKIEMMEDKVKAVTDWPTPTTLRDLRGFIGLISYYRRFIRNLAKIMNLLTSLLKKESAYSWTPEHEEAFQQLKTAITTAPGSEAQTTPSPSLW